MRFDKGGMKRGPRSVLTAQPQASVLYVYR